MGNLKDRDAIVAGTKDGHVFVWGKEGYLIWDSRKLSTSILGVAVGKLGKQNAVAIAAKKSSGDYESDIFVFNEEGQLYWKHTKEYTVPTAEAFHIAVGRLGGRGDVVVAGSTSSEFRYLQVWDSMGRPLWSFNTPVGSINSVAVGRLGKTDAVAASAGSKEHKIYMWDERGVPLWNIPVFDPISDIVVGKFGKGDVLAGGSKSGNVYVWDERGYPIMKLTGPKLKVTCLDIGQFEGEDVIVAGSKDGNVYVWNGKGELLWKLTEPSKWINDVSLGHFGIGEVIAAGSKDGYVYAWGTMMDVEDETGSEEDKRCGKCGTKNPGSAGECVACSNTLS